MTRLSTKLFLTAVLSAVAGSQAIVAQQLKAVADIPFTFRTAGRTMPAGTYAFSEKNTYGLFQVTSKATSHSSFVSLNVPDGGPPAESKLTFACYGRECVLTNVAIAGATNSNSASPDSIDRNLSRNLRLATMISIPLKSR